MFPDSTIFVTDNNIPVFWCTNSVLEADMICFRELLERNKKWKMVANIAGSELPMVPHQKFRESLKRANGNVVSISRNPNLDRRNYFERPIRSFNQSKSLLKSIGLRNVSKFLNWTQFE